MPDYDLFHFFRSVLGWFVTIYCTVVSVQGLLALVSQLSGQDRFITIARQYLVVHALRLRLTSFFGDLLICLLLCVAFGLLWYAHGRLALVAEVMRHG